MSLLRTIIGGLSLLLALFLVSWLVYSNDELVPLKLVGLWGGQGMPSPFAWLGAEPGPFLLPIGLWFFAFAVFGTCIGLFLGWFIGGQTRIQARQQGRRARQAERALDAVRQESDSAKSEMDNLKIEKKDLETKVKQAEAAALTAPAEVKKLADHSG